MKSRPAQGNRWTLVLVRGGTARVRQYSLPRVWVKRLAVAGCVFGVFLAAALAMLIADAGARARAASLERENRLLKAEMDRIEIQVAGLDREMATLAERDERVRALAGLMGIDQEVLEVGIGGPGLETPEEGTLGRMDPEVSEAAYAIRYDVAYLLRRAELLGSSFTEVEASLTDQHELLEATPSIAPVMGRVSSHYSFNRENPVTGVNSPHLAIDIVARLGTPFVATASGRISFAGRKEGYGNMVEIDHGFGLRTRYGHASKLHVRAGQRVQRGEVIGEVGSSGSSTGSHVHYEVHRNGRPVNPSNYILWPPAR